MSRKNNTLRIDELLLKQGLVSEDQVKTALDHQREHGGRLGSHFLRLGYITEQQLLDCLAEQFDCGAVALACLNIPEDVIQMLPANVALARTAVPFAYDKSTDTLSIACEDPTNPDLESELRFVTGRQVKLFVAAEMSLRAAITRHYTATELSPAPSGNRPSGNTKVLIVSDDPEGDKPLIQALRNEEFEVVSTESADDAIGLIGADHFFAVLLRDTVSGDYIDLIDRLRKVSPRTTVRFYESAAQMMLRESGYGDTEGLVVKNAELFLNLLAAREGVGQHNHATVVGRYSDKLCRQLGLPDKDRISIVTAAYLHDISRFYYGESSSASDCRTRVQMTAKLLDSLNYPPLVVGILRSMYIDLEQKFTKRLPIEPLGGNILTIVDVFCEHVSFDRRLSLDKFEMVRAKLQSLTGHLFLKEVTEAFIELIEKEILDESPDQDGTFNQVLLHSSDTDYLDVVAGRLREEGYRPVAMSDPDKFAEVYRRSRPNVIILIQVGPASRARELVAELIGKGVDLRQVPTFLVCTGQVAPELAEMLDRGLEDVLAIENCLDLLVVKLHKLRERFAKESPRTQAHPAPAAPSVTAGNLEDMNLVDLLQALGPSCRTAKINVSSEGAKLTICLDKGKIIFAEGDDRVGAEAVFEGVSWHTGKWAIQPIKEDELPPANTDCANEALLMEGCRRLDEKSRTPSA
jgi:DNA-binding response OmpR family regulator